MKTVKVKYVGFWPGFNPDSFFVTHIMRKHYDIQICDDPDYIICSGFGFYEYLGYSQVRIMFSGENYVPDFNYVDYAISPYPLDFMDRHFSFPGLVGTEYDMFLRVSAKNRDYTHDILNEKCYFANMIAGHESDNGLRGTLFNLLNEYKRVEAAGSFLNNMPDGTFVQRDGSKYCLQKKCKFTICPESTVHNGFITEKIFDAFDADTIPIYCGSPTISEIVNKKAYIDVRDFDNLDDILERVIELDTDDEKYLEMLCQPIFVRGDYIETKVIELENFICNIFDQPMEKAYRRSGTYIAESYENKLIKARHVNKINEEDLPRWNEGICRQICRKHRKIMSYININRKIKGRNE